LEHIAIKPMAHATTVIDFIDFMGPPLITIASRQLGRFRDTRGLEAAQQALIVCNAKEQRRLPQCCSAASQFMRG
jgi:hypothetical protein